MILIRVRKILLRPEISPALSLHDTTENDEISASSPQSICERVTPRLSHANSAVVLSAVKVLMKFLELLPKDSDYYNTLLKKLSPPLVTLLSGEPEVQYVALRNINLIVQKRYIVRKDRERFQVELLGLILTLKIFLIYRFWNLVISLL